MAKKISGKERLSQLAAGVTLGAGVMLDALPANAASRLTRNTGTGAVRWSIDFPPPVGASYCSLSGAALGQLNSTGSFIESRGNAFDSALQPFLHLVTNTTNVNSGYFKYPQSEPPTVTPFGVDSGASVSGTCTATVDSETLSGIYTLSFDKSTAKVTGQIVITNDSASSFSGAVSVYTNLGSDDDTVVHDTSSGDDVLTSDDTWVVTSDANPLGDPVILSFTSSKGAYVGPYTDVNSGNDSLVWKTNVSNLAPGQSITISAGHQLFRTVDEAREAGQALNPVVPPVSVPAMTNFALLTLAGCLGLFGGLSMRSRKRQTRHT